MTVALTTRGRICRTNNAVALATAGRICPGAGADDVTEKLCLFGTMEQISSDYMASLREVSILAASMGAVEFSASMVQPTKIKGSLDGKGLSGFLDTPAPPRFGGSMDDGNLSGSMREVSKTNATMTDDPLSGKLDETTGLKATMTGAGLKGSMEEC